MLPGDWGGHSYSLSHTNTTPIQGQLTSPRAVYMDRRPDQTHFTHSQVTIKPPSDPLPRSLLHCSSSIRRGGPNCLIFSYNSPLSLCVSVPPCPPHTTRQHKKMEGRKRRRDAQTPFHNNHTVTTSQNWICSAMKGRKTRVVHLFE